MAKTSDFESENPGSSPGVAARIARYAVRFNRAMLGRFFRRKAALRDRSKEVEEQCRQATEFALYACDPAFGVNVPPEIEKVRLENPPIPDWVAWWQPIETAAKDGTLMLLFYPVLQENIHVGSYTKVTGEQKLRWWSVDGLNWNMGGKDVLPTHWMPLPNPPK